MNPSDSERIDTGPLPTAAVFANCEYDFQSGRFSWTDRPESLFGTVPRTVDAFLEHVRSDERERVWNTLWRALSDRGTHDFEYPCIHLDGAERWHAWYGRPLVDPAGRARGLAATVVDVTTRRLTERAQLEELAEAQSAAGPGRGSAARERGGGGGGPRPQDAALGHPRVGQDAAVATRRPGHRGAGGDRHPSQRPGPGPAARRPARRRAHGAGQARPPPGVGERRVGAARGHRDGAARGRGPRGLPRRGDGVRAARCSTATRGG